MAMMKGKVFILALCLLSITGKVTAQGKLERWINSVYDYMEGDSANDRRSKVFAVPIWGVYPETGWQLGLSLVNLFRVTNDSITRPSLLRFNTFFTEYSQYSFRPYIDVFTRHNRFNIRSSYTYTKFVEYFWGIGNTSTDAGKERYDFVLNRFQLRTTYRFLPSFFAGLQYQFEQIGQLKFSPGSALRVSGLPGSGGSFTSGLGLVLSFDKRSQIYFPVSGYVVDVASMFNNKSLGSDYDFVNVIVDARKYQSLWKENVLAFQLFANLNDGDVPFRQMGTLGSDSYMRGYYNGRFRDKNAFAAQVELRKKIWGPLSFTLFTGLGNVAGSPDGLFTGLKPNYGLGLRCIAIRKEHVNMRVDYGRGENNIQGLYFTMSEAF